MMYYEFSGSPKAKDMAALIKKKGEESQRTMEKGRPKHEELIYPKERS